MNHALKPTKSLLVAALALAACTEPVPAPVARALVAPSADALTDLSLACAEPAEAVGNVGRAVLLLGGCSSDPDGRALAYSWRLTRVPPGSRAVLNDPALASPSFVPDVPGEYEASLTVENGTLSARDTLTISVKPCGVQEPVVDAIAFDPPAPDTGAPVRLAASFSDADTGTECGLVQTFVHEWKIVRQPPRSTAALNATQSATPSFIPDEPGEYDLHVVIADSTGRRSAPFVATVTAGACGGRTPTILGLDADPPVPTVGAAVLLTAAVDDADTSCGAGDELSYAWSLTSIPRGSRARLNDASVRAPSFTADVAGDYTVRLVVTDRAGRQSAPRAITISVPPCGSAPPSVAGLLFSPASPDIGEPVQLSAVISDADTETGCDQVESFSYTWQIVAQPAQSTARLNNPAAENPSFVPDKDGRYAVRLWVADRAGHVSAPRVDEVIVSTCGGAAPAVSASAADPTPDIGQVVELAASVTDPDADVSCGAHDPVYAYQWWFAELPMGSQARLNDPEARTPSFVADVAGTYVVRVLATDPTWRVSEVFEVTVVAQDCGGARPTVAPLAAPAAPRIGQPVALDAAAADADAAVGCAAHAADFTYRWWMVEAPAGSAARINDAGAARPSFVPDLPGRYTLRVIATDPTGRQSAPGEVSVVASACGSAVPVPTIAAFPASPGVGAPVQLAVQVADADTEPGCDAHLAQFTYAWWFLGLPAGSFAALNDPGAQNPSFVPDVPGDYLVQVSAQDPTGRVGASTTLTVTVGSCGGVAPTVTAGASSATPNVGQVTQIFVTIADSDTDPGCAAHPRAFNSTWIALQLPPGSQAALNDPAARNPSFTPDVPGTYSFGVRVTDPTGRVGRATVTVVAGTCGSNAPVAAIAGPTSANVGQAVQLDGSGSSDLDVTSCGIPQPLSYRWSLTELPAGSNAALNAPDAIKPSFVPDKSGTYVVQLVVTDSTGRASLPATRIVTVGTCGEQAPSVSTVTAAPASPAVGQVVRLAPTFTDPDTAVGCAAHPAVFFFDWAFVSVPAGSGASFNDRAAREPSFRTDLPGAYVYRVIISDPTGRWGSFQGTVTASTCGTNPPVANPTFTVGAVPEGIGVSLDPGNVTDADTQSPCNLTQSFSYFWRLEQVPAGSQAFIPNPTAQRPSFLADLSGTYVASLTVSDSLGITAAPKLVTINAGTVCGSQTPTAAIQKTSPGNTGACNNVTINHGAGAPTNIQIDAVNSSDPDNICAPGSQTLSFDWNLLATPVGATSVLNNPRARNPWFQANVNGQYQVRLVVEDSTGRRSAPVVCTINVP